MAKKKVSSETATLPRRFEFDEATSSKFWEVTLSRTSVTVTFGRIGTNGQTRTTEFGDSTSAESDFQERIRAKVSKGYVEVEISQQKVSPPKVTSARSEREFKKPSDVSIHAGIHAGIKPGRPPNPVELNEAKQELGLMVMIERKKAGLTQRQCAEKLGIRESAWSNAERGVRVSVSRLLEMIANVNLAALPEAVTLAKSKG